MGRVYVSFGDLSFTVSSSDFVTVADLLKEIATRAHSSSWTTLEAHLLDAAGEKRTLLTSDAVLAHVLSEDKADIVVSQKAAVGAAEAMKAKGNELMNAGKFREAATVYTQAMEATSDVALLHVLLLNRSLAHMRLEEWSEAERDACAVMQADGENVKARFRLGQALFHSGRYDECHAVLAAALDLDGLANQQAVEIGRLIEKCENQHGAGLGGVTAETVAAARAAHLPVAGYVRLKPYFDSAAEAMQERMWATAMSTYWKILEVVNAEDYTSLRGMGVCLLESKSHRYAEASTVLEKLCALHPSCEAWRLLGEAQYGAKRLDQALESFGKASKMLASEPKLMATQRADLNVWVSKVLLAQERLDLAHHYVANVLTEDESNVKALIQYGYVVMRRSEECKEEEVNVAIRTITAHPRNRDARRFFCAVMRRRGAVRHIMNLLALLGKGGKFDPESYYFLATVAKEYSAIDAAIVLMRQAAALTPAEPRNTLSLVHLLEIDMQPNAALDVIRHWLEANPDYAMGGLAASKVLRAWTGGDTITNSTLLLQDAPSKGVPQHLSPSHLDYLALLFALVKLLFLQGKFEAIPGIVRLIEPERSGWDFHLTGIRNEQAYYCCAVQCVEARVKPTAVAQQTVHVVGDSHCLPLAWQTVDGGRTVLQPHLVTGCKMWHLRPEGEFFPKHNWQRALDEVPDESSVMFVLGEIDCREGLLVCISKGRYASLEEGIEVVVKIFLDEAVAVARRKRLRKVFIHPVAPVLDATRHIVEEFNPLYHHAVERLPADVCFVWLDIERDLVEPRTSELPHCSSAMQLRPQYALDGTHLHPRYAQLAQTLLKLEVK